jgi:hypothetical protein
MSRQILFNQTEIQQALPQAKDQFIEDYDAVKEDLTSATTNSPVNVTMYFNESVGVSTGWVQIV